MLTPKSEIKENNVTVLFVTSNQNEIILCNIIENRRHPILQSKIIRIYFPETPYRHLIPVVE